MRIEKIHQDVFELLMEHHRKDENFLFTFRQINRKSRLEKGYWFLGDDHYLAVSFWRGRDKLTKMPNIAFTINITGHTTLELNSKDAPSLYQFFNVDLLDELDIDPEPYRVHYRKSYNRFKNNEYLLSLESFIKHDKEIIDKAVDNEQAFYGEALEITDGIERIFPGDFKAQLAIIERYQKVRTDRQRKTGYLKELYIKKFGPISNMVIKDIPNGCKWIFLTGENGAGKTSVLRALATGLTNNYDHGEEVAKNFKDFEVHIGLDSLNGIQRTVTKSDDEKGSKARLVKGLAVYGPVRLLTEGSEENPLFKIDKKSISFFTTFGLFNPIGVLRDISGDYVLGVKPKYYEMTLDDFLENITQNLPLILPNIYEVEIRNREKGHEVLYFQGNTKLGIDKTPTSFNHLPSGTRNFAALILDLLIRFSEQQSEVRDMADFVGIVLIDEIDLHLHPKLQREIIIQLADTFPNIQFIVTTHSPIPMLGAPKNSVFINISKDENDLIEAKNINIDITGLLPNAILSSPIFDFDSLININHQPGEKLNTEDDYNEAVFYNILERKIRERSLNREPKP